MKRAVKKLTENYSVDHMMSQIAIHMIKDFRENLADNDFCSSQFDLLRSNDIKSFRQIPTQLTYHEDPYTFKCRYQIESLLKRHRYQNDTYTDKELVDKAIFAYNDTQSRLKLVNLDDLSTDTGIVLSLARVYASRILGAYCDEEHRSLCRFGKRASIGIPARKACEGERWEPPMSGSREQISWFDSEMSQIPQVQEYWSARKGSDRAERSTYQEVNSLKLTLVPKTFKSLRSIMPNTTIGSYQSYGLGEMIRKRLKRHGFDIRTLQERHRMLAMKASVNDLFVTADLSSASDSITDALVRRILPSDWYDILSRNRISTVVLPDGSECESLTFCTMGIGYTFPLQTLVFLSLLKAIEAFNYKRFDKRTISVYGDDMIYSSRMHEQVVYHFSNLGFVINIDKTFHEGHFRESCGGDYYHGVDVRPFQPRTGQSHVGRKTYEAMLYKMINGLLRRWPEHEVQGTLNFLYAEVNHLGTALRVVPADFPDDSGVRCSPHDLRTKFSDPRFCKPKHLGSGLYRFSFLRFIPELRKEDRHEPYLWNALRGGSSHVMDYSGEQSQWANTAIQELITTLVGIRGDSSLLIWREDRHRTAGRRRSNSRRSLRRLAAYVTIGHTGTYQRQSGVSGFETHR